MQPLYVVGGEQKDDLNSQDEWHVHRAGTVARIDPQRGEARTLFEYQSPPELCPDQDPSFLFKASTLHGDRFYTCTSTEVLIYSFPDMELLQRITHPCFNDLHHINISPDGLLYVANTGLDSVVEMAPDGEITRHWSVLDGLKVWERFSQDVDYRKVLTTKPHLAHPNYVFFVDGDVWVTRCKQRDAICLTRPGRRFAVGEACPVHDGIVTDHGIYFTQVDGKITEIDGKTLQLRAEHDLAAMMPGIRKPGWCRGLHVVDEHRVLVGFSRLRPTKWQGNLNWLKLTELRWLHRMPARICLFNLTERKVEWDQPLQDFGMTTVFSIHPDPRTEAASAAA